MNRAIESRLVNLEQRIALSSSNSYQDMTDEEFEARVIAICESVQDWDSLRARCIEEGLVDLFDSLSEKYRRYKETGTVWSSEMVEIKKQCQYYREFYKTNGPGSY